MSYYRISYNTGTEKALTQRGIFKYIDNHTLYDLQYVQELTAGQNPLDIDIEDTYISDRNTATDYIKQHRSLYEYIGHDTGNINRIVCVEMDEEKHNKATGALYDHPEHGLIWLEMY